MAYSFQSAYPIGGTSSCLLSLFVYLFIGSYGAYGAFMHVVNWTDCVGGVSCLLLSFKGARSGTTMSHKMEYIPKITSITVSSCKPVTSYKPVVDLEIIAIAMCVHLVLPQPSLFLYPRSPNPLPARRSQRKGRIIQRNNHILPQCPREVNPKHPRLTN